MLACPYKYSLEEIPHSLYGQTYLGTSYTIRKSKKSIHNFNQNIGMRIIKAHVDLPLDPHKWTRNYKHPAHVKIV